ncbi:UDP-3-O-(3-hydroxymyristoyl)glucosamine N-acyltransferase [Mucisphaera calidilacus]|uniref:UDP-3-O-acylglucosamine N-acyltransferase n=1 Tax=Mucisphaera calidilacus TaxID=2527982 RepID=A0A518C0Z7_9BACT|nr:UDP-3-O-(3-hydroxymyristoyl)glucosamine N-acyltransferase [Mucisphaera calidilacus]QDU72880.1 UDP-3-O-acylglucosamine N-acyltransferase [Mucisphaera calidilacus]
MNDVANPTPPITTGELAQQLAGLLRGPSDIAIMGLNDLGHASAGQLTFVGDQRHVEAWNQSQASAALVSEGVEIEPGEGRALIVIPNADLAMARALEYFAPEPTRPEPGVHPSCVIHPTASVSPSASLGPNCIVGARAVVGDGCVLHGNNHLYEDTRLGNGCVLHAGAVLRERCTAGDRCILHTHVCIGGDGFGYRPEQTETGPRIVKIPHLGHVTMGDECEIGGSTCIDRGKFGPTTLGHQVKIDNLCQIGHNCTIGNLVIIAGSCGIGGSVVIKDGATIAGGVVLRDHITIGAGATVLGAAVVGFDVPDGETWGGFPAKPTREWLREVSCMKELPALVKKHRRNG